MKSTELFLLHGWGAGRAAWAPVVERLAATHPELRVTPLDLPGYGNTEATADFTQAAQTLANRLPPGAVLCAWSLGAQLALQAARLAPEKFAGLILVGATPSFVQATGWPDAQPPALLEGFTAAVAADPATALQRFVALFNQGDAQARAIGRRLARTLKETPLPDAASLLAGLAWLRDTDLRAEVANVRTPTLLIHGERDPLMPLGAACWLAQTLPQARLETFADAAHAPFLHDPERFTALVGDFCHASA